MGAVCGIGGTTCLVSMTTSDLLDLDGLNAGHGKACAAERTASESVMFGCRSYGEASAIKPERLPGSL